MGGWGVFWNTNLEMLIIHTLWLLIFGLDKVNEMKDKLDTEISNSSD